MMTNTEAVQLAAHAATTAGQLRALRSTRDVERRDLTSCSQLDLSGLIEDLEELALSLLRNAS